MATGLLIDTDVLIGYLRGDNRTKKYLESIEIRPAISVICAAELYAGARSEQERTIIDQFLQAFEVLPVDQAVAQLAGRYRQAYLRSHGTGLADALIAATAEIAGLALVTLNTPHYPMLADVRMPH